MRIAAGVMLAGVAAALSAPALGALVQKKTPYFASISAGKARMRSGPGRTYPANWLYQRADLPVKVIAVFEKGSWYKVEDVSGTQGWILGALISDVRTGMVTGDANDGAADLREAPRPGARLTWRAAPGVVGRLSKCARGWCYLDVKGRGGYVETSRLFGVAAEETL